MSSMKCCADCKMPDAQFRCSKCKSVNYCSSACQRNDWKSHKAVCHTSEVESLLASIEPSKKIWIVLVEGFGAIEEQRPVSFLASGDWEECPIPNLLGVPLMARKYKPSKKVQTDQRMATVLNARVHDGLAPPRWMGGPHNQLGVVAFARKDAKDFRLDLYYNVWDCVHTLMDLYGEKLTPQEIRKEITPALLQRHINLNAGNKY